MTIPNYEQLMLPLLRIAADKQEHSIRQVADRLADDFKLTNIEKKELLPGGRQEAFFDVDGGMQRVFDNRVWLAKTDLYIAVLIETTRWGHFKITERGLAVLKGNPAKIDKKFLYSYKVISSLKGILRLIIISLPLIIGIALIDVGITLSFTSGLAIKSNYWVWAASLVPLGILAVSLTVILAVRFRNTDEMWVLGTFLVIFSILPAFLLNAALSETQEEKCQRYVQELTSSSENTTRRIAAKEACPDAVEQLIAALDDNDYWVRTFAAERLGEIGDELAIPALEAALETDQLWLHYCASRAIERIEGAELNDWLVLNWRVSEYTPAISGIGTDEMSSLVEGGTPHPIVIVDLRGNITSWNFDLPTEWLPESIAETELVASVGGGYTRIEKCRYERGYTVERYQYQLDVDVWATHTGENLGSQTLYGSSPDRCEQIEYVRGDAVLHHVPDKYGSEVSFNSVKNWLGQFVMREFN